MAAGRKLAGILIEVLPDRRHVIGIGLNTNNTLDDAPADLRTTAATLRDLAQRTFDQAEILVELLRQLECQFARLRVEPAAVAARANGMCLQRGRTLTLRLGNRAITGQCQGIAATGAIQLQTPTGTESFCSGILGAQPRE